MVYDIGGGQACGTIRLDLVCGQDKCVLRGDLGGEEHLWAQARSRPSDAPQARSYPPSYRYLLLLFGNCGFAPAIGKVHGNGNHQYVEDMNHDRLVMDR